MEETFQTFLKGFNEWLPKEYTWLQDKLEEIRIGQKKGDLCTEIGPNGFRCDWGHIVEIVKNEEIKLKWQIGSHREPVPDSAKSSDLLLEFRETNDSTTALKLEHSNFEKHGGQAEHYRNMMNGNQGWDYILFRFKEYCGKSQ